MAPDEIHDVILDAIEQLEKRGHSLNEIVDVLLTTAANCAVEPLPSGTEEHADIVMCRDCFVMRAAEVHDLMANVEREFVEEQDERGKTNGN